MIAIARGAVAAAGKFGGGASPVASIPASSLLFWLDPQTTSSITKDGSNVVTAMADPSQNAYPFTIPSGNCTYSATALSSGAKPGLTFTGFGLSSATIPLGMSQFTIWLVAKGPTDDLQRAVTILGTGDTDPTATTTSLVILGQGVTAVRPYRNSHLGSSAAITAGTQHRFCIVFGASANTMYLDGGVQTPDATAASALASTGKILVGSSGTSDTAFAWGNAIGEVIGMVGAANSTQLSDMDAYLAGRW
jgi:hypothetical protein